MSEIFVLKSREGHKGAGLKTSPQVKMKALPSFVRGPALKDD
jgi:hypothetical protein